MSPDEGTLSNFIREIRSWIPDIDSAENDQKKIGPWKAFGSHSNNAAGRNGKVVEGKRAPPSAKHERYEIAWRIIGDNPMSMELSEVGFNEIAHTYPAKPHGWSH